MKYPDIENAVDPNSPSLAGRGQGGGWDHRNHHLRSSNTLTRRLHILAVWLSACLAFLSAGCARLGTPELTAQVQSIPAEHRDDLHIHLLNSPLDQLALGRLHDVAGYLRKAGFQHASYKHWVDGNALGRDLLELREKHPDARITLVGWSGGSLACWDAATVLAEHDQLVDCLIYLDSNWIKGRIEAHGHPDNIIRLVCIYNRTRQPPEGLPSATVYRVDTTNHMAVPTHDETIEAIITELTATATQSRF